MTDNAPAPQSKNIPQTKRVNSKLEYPYRFPAGNKIANRYEIIEPLGVGGFSEVYKCVDQKLKRIVAVKVLKEKEATVKEAETAARLIHPHIVQIFDTANLKDGTPIIVFRFVDGETLEDRLNNSEYRRLPLDKNSLTIIRHVAEALDYAHGLNIVHRDVKPSNIIINKQDHVNGEEQGYLTDFGLAEVKGSLEADSMLSTEFTQRFSGTIPYMAPEQINEGETGSPQTDLYSLGVVVYEMLTGRLPYQGRDAQLIVQIARSHPLPPKMTNPDIPAGVENVLLQVLNKNPNERYDNCLAFVEALETAAQAYVDAREKYDQAMKLAQNKKWRDALAAFESLQYSSPDFKDVPHQLKQAKHQVQLLKLYEQAEALLREKKYQETLDKLQTLKDMESEYDIDELRTQAEKGRAAEKQESLAQQYERAKVAFAQKDYDSVVAIMSAIREQSPGYPDKDGIEAPAREHVEYQRELLKKYNQAVEYQERQEWEQALTAFQAIKNKEPNYKRDDIDSRLATVKHLHRLSNLLQEAADLFEKTELTASIDKLDELKRIDAEYKQSNIDRLRRDATDRLHQEGIRQLEQNKFEACLETLTDLKQRSSEYADLEDLENQAKEGIRKRGLQKTLDTLYAETKTKLSQKAHLEALQIWAQLQQEKETLDYDDPIDVVGRAKDGLYMESVDALAEGDASQALKLWQQLQEFDPQYNDYKNVEERAQKKIKRQEALIYWGVRVGAGVVALVLIFFLGRAIFSGIGGGGDGTPTLNSTQMTQTAVVIAQLSATPAKTPTPTNTNTPSPTTAPTATPTPTNTSEPSATPTKKPTNTPAPSSTPEP